MNTREKFNEFYAAALCGDDEPDNEFDLACRRAKKETLFVIWFDGYVRGREEASKILRRTENHACGMGGYSNRKPTNDA